MKNILNAITTIFLFIFSLLYSKRAILFVQNRDPLVKEIKEKQNEYNIEPIDAIITKNYMIPGISGRRINIIESFKKMRKIHSFNKSLIIFDKIPPNKSIQNIYDKVIIRGNRYKKQIVLIINVNNIDNISNINKVLLNNNIFLDIYSKKFIDIKDTNFINIISDNNDFYVNFCLYNNYKIIDNCINNKKYTIKVIPVKTLQDIKNTISNGIIYLYNINNIQELNIIIKYLRNNNYEIINLNEMVKE